MNGTAGRGEGSLTAHLVRDAAGQVRILAPVVGRWLDPPPASTLVGAGTRLGRLLTLNRSRELLMPAGVVGTIVGISTAREIDVAYGDLLFRVSEAAIDENSAGPAAGSGRPAGSDLPDGSFAVTAPTDGVFYSRPAPEAAPFVTLGSTIRRGQPIGLVEVMKTFNQIAYGGSDLPEQASIVEIRCTDGDEIQAGQILVVVESKRSG